MMQVIRRTDVLTLLTGLLLTLCFTSISNGETEVKKESETMDRIVVARVNGQPIYKEALTPYMEQELKKFRKYGMKRKISPEITRRMETRALDKVIAQELLSQESKQIKVDDIEKTVDEQIKKMKIKYRTGENFKNYLASKKLTENEVRENLRRGIYVEQYLEKKGIQNPAIPEAELRSYYEDTKGDYRRDEYIKASHILIQVDEKASQEKQDEAHRKAEKIWKEIMDRKDFAGLARKYSEDGKSASGGDLGYIKRGYMPPEFDAVAFSMKKDEISEVVRTKFGFHIIKVNDRKPAGIAPFDEVRDFIEKFLQNEVSRKKLAMHLEELKGKANIEVLLNDS
jgi:peptidyl-prolyl cis-trans isomerase C